MTIVVGGYIVGYPLGGMTWHHLNYVLGFLELGHEVVFLEDSGEYSVPYNPVKQRCEPDSAFGRAYLQKTLDEFRLPIRWCYYTAFEDRHYGMSRDELDDVLRRAELLLCVSGVTPIRSDRPRARRTAVIDTDPGFTQIRLGQSSTLLEYYRQFDAVATFGPLIANDPSLVFDSAMSWIPTRQPVSLRHWPIVENCSRRFTTIGKWEHTTDRHVELNGRRYLSSKAVEWMKLLDLPSRTNWDLCLAMQSMFPEVQQQFRQRGWQISDSEQATSDCKSFQQFIHDSAAELTVVKQIYASILTGWFSDRSACYLASGRPVVTQSTGFERWLPTGEGLLAFTNIDEAADAIARVESDYPRHSRTARRIAEEHFDSRKVLTELLDAVM